MFSKPPARRLTKVGLPEVPGPFLSRLRGGLRADRRNWWRAVFLSRLRGGLPTGNSLEQASFLSRLAAYQIGFTNTRRSVF